MDRISNPFAPGAGNPPPELAGRSHLLEEAHIALARIKSGKPAQGIILTGLRGVGKTVLLTEIGHIAQQQGYEAISLEAHEAKPLAELLVPSLRELLYQLSRIEGAKQLAARGLRVLRGFLSSITINIEGVTFGLGVEPETGTADSGDLEADLPRLFEVIGEAAKAADKPIVLLIDEIQYLQSQEFSALIMALHRINQRQLPITMIAAGLPQTLALAGNSKSYAERLFKYPMVGELQKEDAALALTLPARQEGVEFSSEAIDLILETTRRYPYFLQQWGHDTWNAAAASPIRKQDVEVATVVAISELDQSFFKVRFDRCTPSEKRYMRALADLGPGTQRSGEVAEKLKVKVTSLGPVRNGLIRKGMIYSPAHGDTAFTVPLFDEFMMRVMPQIGDNRE
ncbi:MAG: ATP-binding protein [Hyphomicrobiales bacterium]|nr:ATP-binding protein [Nitratireductor sp.]MCC2097532.1 ATP-binding protein [Hyphomicrobiales bacterium]